MAIQSNNKKRRPRQASGDALFRTLAKGQPPAFKATGKGWFNNVPDFPATSANANGSLTNLVTPPGNGDLRKLYLFVYGIETGWKLSGDSAQTQGSRTFYPRHLAQDELLIYGQVANQYEYDRLTRFVVHHHDTILDQVHGFSDYYNDDFHAVDFKLFRPVGGRTFDHFKGQHYSVSIGAIEAGHERFKNTREFRLTCRVFRDYLAKNDEVEQGIRDRINYRSVFGRFDNPQPVIAATVRNRGVAPNKNTNRGGD